MQCIQFMYMVFHEILCNVVLVFILVLFHDAACSLQMKSSHTAKNNEEYHANFDNI